MPSLVGISSHLGFHILAVQPFVGSLTWRVALKHFTGHVGVAEAVWKMTCNVSNVSRLVILQIISSVTLVLYAKKVVSFAEGCLILGSMLNLCWL